MVYVVIENGIPYECVYRTFELAVAAVKEKHKETIEDQLREADGEPLCSDLTVPENTLTGHTSLYVEKGIYIEIYKLPIVEG